MKMLITATTTLLTLGLFAGTASARPGDRGPDRDRWSDQDRSRDDGYDGRDNDGDGWADEYDENTTYAVPNFEREVRHGRMHFKAVKRMMKVRMMQRIAERTQQIHDRFGYGRRAERKIARMEAREYARFNARLAWARARFDEYRRTARYDHRADARTGYVYAQDSVTTW